MQTQPNHLSYKLVQFVRALFIIKIIITRAWLNLFQAGRPGSGHILMAQVGLGPDLGQWYKNQTRLGYCSAQPNQPMNTPTKEKNNYNFIENSKNLNV